jgi:lysozyme family protein
MEAKKQMWTDEDKAWAIGGGVVAAGGLIYWYMQSQKASATDAVAGTDTTYIDSAENAVAIDGSSSEQNSSSSGTVTTPISTKRQPDPVRWQVGQVMMANSKAGTKTYQAKKMANGQYTSDGTLAKTFAIGDQIGKIVWVGAYADGTFRYVIEVEGTFSNDAYWIADYRVITPIDGSKAIATKTVTTTALNPTLVLKKGSKGLEVRELQKRLGIAVDGDFGAKTLAALQAQKKVSQITLAAFATTNISTLNFNLILKKGSKGLEVKELQKRLGFTGSNVDGDFGTKTESALFAMKAVKQTTLNQFSYV